MRVPAPCPQWNAQQRGRGIHPAAAAPKPKLSHREA